SFNQLKVLTGAWSGKTSEGKPVDVTFRDTAGGSAFISEIRSANHGHEDMVSMINMDGPNRIMLTHYCSAGNQPRMAATGSPDGKTLTFDFIDATNLASPDSGHMQRVVFTMLDANHHTEEWDFVGEGKEKKEVFDLRRN